MLTICFQVMKKNVSKRSCKTISVYYLSMLIILFTNYRQLKSTLIGSNKQKHAIIEQGVVPRLINMLSEPNSNPDLQINVAYTLGSIAKGMDIHLKALIDSGVVNVMLQCRSTL